MDVPTTSNGIRETPAVAPAATPLPSAAPSEVVIFLPRPAQWTAGTLLAGLLLWLTIQSIARWAESFEAQPLPKLQLNLNDATSSQLVQLPGVGPSLAERIAAYREANGPFRSLNDLRRVPGIGPAMMDKLRRHVFVSDKETRPETKTTETRVSLYPPVAASTAPKPTVWSGPPLDLNRASAADLDKLPGIGPKLTERIIEFRKNRPFTAVEDLRKVSGIGPKTLEKIRPYVVVHVEKAGADSVK